MFLQLDIEILFSFKLIDAHSLHWGQIIIFELIITSSGLLILELSSTCINLLLD